MVLLVLALGVTTVACRGGGRRSAEDRLKELQAAQAKATADTREPRPVPALPASPPPAVDKPLFDPQVFPDQAIRDALARLKRSGQEGAVMAELFAINKEASLKALIAALSVANPNVRTQAAHILVASKEHGEAITAGLRELLTTEQDADVLANVVSFIDAYKEPGIAEPVLQLLRTHQDTMVRAYAAEALGSLRYAKAKPDIIKGLEDKESWVRLMSLSAIRKMRAVDALPAVRKLVNDPNPRVKERAREVLASLGG
jgi:HEAT repeat protein